MKHTLKLPKFRKFEKAISKYQDTRFATEMVSVENGTLRVTNGRIALRQKNATDFPGKAYLSKDAIKAAHKANQEVTLEDSGHQVTADTGLAKFDATPTCEFPNVDNVIPTMEGQEGMRVAIDARLLFDLAEAMGAQSEDSKTVRPVVLCLGANPRQPILVLPWHYADKEDQQVEGVIMPMTTPEWAKEEEGEIQ